MVKTKAEERKNHDECVREIADELKKDKWDVTVDVEGEEEKTSKIGGFRSYIEAQKGCLRRICEVLTEKDFEDKQHYIEFRNYCDEYDFGFYVVDKDGKRRKSDPKTFGKKIRAVEK